MPRTSHHPDQVTVVRPAVAEDAEALHRLSRTFMRNGALRERPVAQYARDAGDFLVAANVRSRIDGCVALRRHPAPPRTCRLPGASSPTPADTGGPLAVVYNFCVAPGSQGRGIGSALLEAALAGAAARSVSAVFTATTGNGELFLRHGFRFCDGRGAPAAWLDALDPHRGSRILVRPVTRAR
ncbi:GNAT family N-acetyltransferase [Streptomyces sp. NPDC091376]|uniref:GNAT family N-acetyltransferase n=1 Tax=Streptomyces sp. NPDC091376 TaxID=3365994 RepID=UPI003828678E